MAWEGTYVHVWLHLGLPCHSMVILSAAGLEEPRGAWVSGTAYLESHRSPPGRLFALPFLPHRAVNSTSWWGEPIV